MNNDQISKKSKIKNIILIIVMLLAIASIVTGIFLLKNDNEKVVENSKDSLNNNIIDEEVEEAYSIGVVDEDTNITYDENGAFLFSIEDVFTISGRGTVVTGRVQRGTVKVGDKVQIIGLNEEILTTEVIGVEMFREQKDKATIGENAGIILKDVTRDQVARGQILAKPNSIVASTKFDADISVISSEDEEDNTLYDKSKLQIYFRDIVDVNGEITLSNGEEIELGKESSATITLEDYIAMEVGMEFSIRENGFTIAKGIITKIY